LLETVPHLSHYYDEPFADSSQIPSMLVSELARRHVTVALSGDGGDEIFGGYNRYRWSEQAWKFLRFLPRPLRTTSATLAGLVPQEMWRQALSPLQGRFSKPHELAQKFFAVMPMNGVDEVYQRLLASWQTPDDLVFGCERPLDLFAGKPLYARLFSNPERAMFLDQQVYLPDDNLQKVDRASMSVALEVRVPLLDHRVVEFAARLPLSMKIRNKESKWLLRQLLYRYVPREMIERPKMGFSVPLGDWISGPLRPWAEDLLNTGSIRGQGLLRSDPVRKLWDEHTSGKFNRQHELWNVLMFQSWLEKWK
jgi:asparagine synthase (glutamine-hydrolysing)